MEVRQIKGYENYYISDEGVVFKMSRGELKEKTTFPSHNGYKRVALFKNGKGKKYFVHRLVADHFVDNPYGKNSVDHIDRDILNNRKDNLRWVSIEYNSGQPKSKLTKKEAEYIRSHYKRGNGTCLSERFNIDLSAVVKISKGKSYKWIDEEVN